MREELGNFCLAFLLYLRYMILLHDQNLCLCHQLRKLRPKFHFEYATGYLPYLLIGWYLTTFPPKKAMRFVLYGLGLAAALICVFGVQAWVKDIPDIRDYLVEATTLPALLYGVGLFTLICALAGGVYILHVAVLDVLVNILLPYKAFGEQYPLWYILTLFALTAIGSLIVVLPLSKVKGARKIFHY